VCKTYYIDCLIKEIGINNNTGNPTYTPTSLSKDDTISNHKSVISSFVLSFEDNCVGLSSLFWMPGLHGYPYRHGYVAGSARSSTGSLSRKILKIL